MSLMGCPACGSTKNGVTDSRPSVENFEYVRRRRCCESCGVKFTTYEVHAKSYLEVLSTGRKIAGARRALESAQHALIDVLEMVPGQALPKVRPVDPR